MIAVSDLLAEIEQRAAELHRDGHALAIALHPVTFTRIAKELNAKVEADAYGRQYMVMHTNHGRVRVTPDPNGIVDYVHARPS